MFEGIFKEVKKAYERYNHKIVRAEFVEAVRKGNYVYALRLAEHSYEKIGLSLNDIHILRNGFEGYQTKLKNLELLIKK